MPFLILLIAHVAADWTHRPERIAPRDAAVAPDDLRRAAVYAAYISAAAFLWWPSLAPLLIGGLMFLVRAASLSVGARAGEGRAAELRFCCLSLAAHACALFLLSKLLPGDSWLIAFLSRLTGAQIGARQAFLLLAYLVVCAPAAEFVRRMLGALRGSETAGANRAGYWIGILERVIILTLGIGGQYAVIGFVLAAKSIARLKEFENRDFAEQYIVGTLASIGVAILLASVYHALPI